LPVLTQSAVSVEIVILACSPVSPITNVLPLVLVLSVSLAKEAFEDRKRAAKDKEVLQAQSYGLFLGILRALGLGGCP